MPDLDLDASRSRVQIQTFAEGLLARLAHDLELRCSDLSGTASRTAGDQAPSGTASLEAPLRAFEVAGVLGKDGRVDPQGLSASEQRDVIAKMQREVFHAGQGGVVRVEVQLTGTDARLRIVPPHGKTVETVVRPELQVTGDTVRAQGSFDVSLAAIGSDAVKGPMGAFRVKDRVRVLFDIVFTART